MKTALIFKSGLLPPTQTFIPAQTEGLKKFRYTYVGLEEVTNGYKLKAEAVLLVQGHSWKGRFQKVWYKALGRAPSFFQRLRLTNPSILHAHLSWTEFMLLEL